APVAGQDVGRHHAAVPGGMERVQSAGHVKNVARETAVAGDELDVPGDVLARPEPGRREAPGGSRPRAVDSKRVDAAAVGEDDDPARRVLVRVVEASAGDKGGGVSVQAELM